MPRPIVVLLLCSSIILVLLSVCLSAQDEREPNKLEWCYMDLALQLKDSSLCEKISPQAVYSSPWSQGDTQIAFWRSECFCNVARAKQDPQLCQYVSEYKSPFLNGSGISEASCRKAIESSETFNNSGYMCDEELLLQTLGYDYTNMSKDELKGGYPFYFLNNPEIRAKLKTLPDLSKAETISQFKDVDCQITDPYERYKCYVDKLLNGHNPDICEQIDRKSSKFICRALFARDPAICEQMPAPPELLGPNLDCDDCNAMLGMHNKDLNVCKKIKNWSYKRDCIVGIAILEKNPDLCNTVDGDESEKQWCREYVLRSIKDEVSGR